MVSAGIVIVRQLILWTPDFVAEFLLNGDINAEKISVGMIAFGCFLVAWGFRRKDVQY